MQQQVPLTEREPGMLLSVFQICSHSRESGYNQEGSEALEAVASLEPRW